MHVKHHTRKGSFLVGVAAWILRWLLRLLVASCRLRVVAGREHLETLLGNPRPVILSFWHNRSFLAAPFCIRSLHRRGFAITLLASRSRDGELVTRVFRPWGIDTVRGSASRGGREALRALHRAITRKGSSPIVIPDGPRGPLYDFKVGVAVLAQMSQAPILPLGFAVRRAWRIRSWDRMFVPAPFTRITVTVGEPQEVPRGLGTEELEAERQRLQKVLDDVTAEAAAAAGC